MTNWTEIENFEGMLVEVNRYGPFWTLMLFMLFSVFLISFIPYGYFTAMITASFLAFIIGLFLAYMGLVAWKWVMALLGIMILMFILKTLFGKKES